MIGSLLVSPLRLGVWTLCKMKDLTLLAWDKLPKPKSFTGKCIVYPLYVYVVIPGSVPYALVKMAEWAGYGEEMSQLYDILFGALGSLGWLALDAFVKSTLAALWFMITWLTHL